MTFAPRFTITNATALALTKIERARGFLDVAKLSEEWIAGMQDRALILGAHYTAAFFVLLIFYLTLGRVKRILMQVHPLHRKGTWSTRVS